MVARKTIIVTGVVLAAIGAGAVLKAKDAQYASMASSASKTSTVSQSEQELPASLFVELLRTRDRGFIDAALDDITTNWRPSYAPMVLESAVYAPSPYLRSRLFQILNEKTGQDLGFDFQEWFYWLWNQPEAKTSDYADFKAALYREIDPIFEGYFSGRQESAQIRLDEIRWGGVVQDGIPPLRSPKMISARQATYLGDDNIVFGIEINGDARAYPKRILAWHEMFTDTVGGVDVAGVYCTLCGTVIPYKTQHKGVDYKLGTSGFLYRSNKLMYDQETQSLWNTIKGEPVVGPLVGKGIALEHLSVVTTTWGEWKRRHPKTKVLSLKTGHRRDYGEGVAYQEYFATDRLMFNTPFRDDRLKNKQEVLALRFAAAPTQQLAIDTKFLDKNPVYTDSVGTQDVVVLTDSSGANRVYDPRDVNFVSYDRDQTVTDDKGTIWELSEDVLTSSDGRRLERLPYHRAFWFGWQATYPDTRLVK